MLEMIDLLIGLVVVLLVVSFAVTVLTQLIVGLLNLRGGALCAGVTNLLVLIDNGISRQDAGQIAGLVLRDPLVAQPRMISMLGYRPAAVVHREELTKLLLGFALDPAKNPAPWQFFLGGPSRAEVAGLQTRMAASLAGNGITDPAATLEQIRTAALSLEKTNPALSNSDRANIAILNFAGSDFLGKLNAWFDQTVDRVSDTFTGWTHMWAVVMAFVVAFAIQLDTISLIDRLSTDKQLREKLVEWAVNDVNTIAPAFEVNGAPAANATDADNATASNTTSAAQDARTAARLALAQAATDALENEKLVVLPANLTVWEERWTRAVPCAEISQQATLSGVQCPAPQVNPLGVLLSAILLSLGGPFWYAALENLLKLRSLVATKDDTQRQARQTNTAPAPAGPGDGSAAAQKPALPPELAGGEAGDLTAIG